MTALISTLSPYGGLFQRLQELFSARDAAVRSAVDEAASVRALADTYRRSDPSFASDLYAAADRHERAAETAAGRL